MFNLVVKIISRVQQGDDLVNSRGGHRKSSSVKNFKQLKWVAKVLLLKGLTDRH